MSQNDSTHRYNIQNLFRDPLTPRCKLITADKTGQQTSPLFVIMKFKEYVIYQRGHASKFPPALKIQLKNCIYSGSVHLEFPRIMETLEMTNMFDNLTDEEWAYVDASCCEFIKKLILTSNKKIIFISNLTAASLTHLEINQYSANCFKDPHLLRNLTTLAVTFGCLFSESGTFFTPPNQDRSSQDRVMDISPLIHLELLRILESWSYYNLDLITPQLLEEGERELVAQLCWELRPTKEYTIVLDSKESRKVNLPLN